MAKIRGIPDLVNRPSLKGQFMINAWRGQLVARAWPHKRGPPKSKKQRQSIETFTNRVALAKYTFGIDQWHAKEFTKQSGTYPRDLILRAMAGRLFEVLMIDGKEHVAVALIDDVSWNLDLLTDQAGSVLARGPDLWGGVAPGEDGYVLTAQAPGLPPQFAPNPHFQEEDLIAFATVNRTSNLSVLDNTPTVIPWQAVISDKFLIWSAAAPTRLTVPVGGLRARPFFSLHWAAAPLFTSIDVRAFFNGAAVAPLPRYTINNVQAQVTPITGPMFDVQAGDYFEVNVTQVSGAAQNMFTSPASYFGLEIYK